MPINMSFANATFPIPADGERNWSAAVNGLLQQLCSYALSPYSGTYTLQAELNFGTLFGMRAQYYASQGLVPAVTGVFRLANLENICWRSNDGLSDIPLTVAGVTNRLAFNGVTVPTITSTDTLLNKTIGGGTVYTGLQNAAGALFADLFASNQVGFPLLGADPVSPPPAGFAFIYGKSDNKIYKMLPSAAVSEIGSGGSGVGVQTYIANGDFEATASGQTPSGWVGYNDGATAVPLDGTGGATSNISFLASNTAPIRGLISTIFTKGAANCQGMGYSYLFTIDAIDKTALATGMLELISSAAYVAGDVGLYLIDVTNGNALITPSSASLPKGDSYAKYFASIGLTTGTQYRLCLHIRTTNASAWTLKLDSVILSTQSNTVPGISPDTDWAVYSPTGSWNNTTYTGIWRRRSANIEIKIGLTLTGVPTGVLSFTVAQMLNGLNLTYNANANAFNANKMPWGQWTGVDTGTADYMGQFGPSDATSATPTCFLIYANGSSLPVASVAATAPFAWNTGDEIGISATFPIAEWAGQTLTQGTGAQVEYAYNSSTSTGTDSTSFASGPTGALFQTYTASGTTAITKRVRFQYPIQQDDTIALEVQTSAGGPWLPHDSLNDGSYGFQFQNAQGYGMYTSYVNTTDIDVSFYQYARPNTGVGYGGVGAAWQTTYRWRVRKCKPTAPVGVKLAGTDGSPGYAQAGSLPGSVTGAAIAAGMIGEVVETVIGPTAASLSNTAFNVGGGVGMVVPSGKWRAEAHFYFAPGTVTANTLIICALNISSAAFPAVPYYTTFSTAAGAIGTGSPVMPLDLNLSAPQNVYFVAQYNFAAVGTSAVTAVIRRTRIG